MFSEEKQKEKFKNHIATFTDYGNIKILDFKNPESSEYRIRFLFEEDYCRLHISGDLGELIATNYYNMTYEKFSAFVNDTGYFEQKIDCHSRAIYYYDRDKAIADLTPYLKDEDLLDDIIFYSTCYYTWELSEEEISDIVNDFIDGVLEDFDDKIGISQEGYRRLSEIDSDAWEYISDIGKQETGILDLYMLAFRLAQEQMCKY